MASAMEVDSEDDDLLQPCIAIRPRIITSAMVDSVLAVCPHASREDIERDLHVTNCVSTTVHRILDRQFIPEQHSKDKLKTQYLPHSPASGSDVTMNDTVELPSPSGKSPVHCLSDTDIDSDTDDSDIVIVEEERKVFTSLKDRIKRKPMESTCTYTNDVNDCSDNTATNRKIPDTLANSSPRKRFSKNVEMKWDFPSKGEKEALVSSVSSLSRTKYTDEILDLTISDEKIDGIDSSSRERAFSSSTQIKTSISGFHDTSDIIDLSFENDDNTESYNYLYFGRTDSSVSSGVKKHEAIGHGNLYLSETTCSRRTDMVTDLSDSESSVISLKMTCQVESIADKVLTQAVTESVNGDEHILKKKKCISEVTTKKQEEAQLKKEAKEREKQAKKEAVERAKLAKQQVLQEKKKEMEKEKLIKKAETMNQKSQKKEECMKNIEVCLDRGLFGTKDNDDTDPILAKLISLGISYSIKTLPIPESITWQRAAVEHRVGDDMKIDIKKSFTEESIVLVRVDSSVFISMVDGFKKSRYGLEPSDSGTPEIGSFCSTLTNAFRDKTITLVITGLENYFRSLKSKRARQFKNAVRGDQDPPAKPKSRKACRDLPLVSRVDVEEVLVYLELRTDFKVNLCETDQDFAEMVAMFTKAVAETPFKKSQPEAFSFYVETGGKSSSVKVTKDGEGLLKVWQQQLQQYNNVSANMAAAIVSVYPSPQLLVKAYEECANERVAALVLKDILVRRGVGVLATSRRIGPELSRYIHVLFTATDGQTLTK